MPKFGNRTCLSLLYIEEGCGELCAHVFELILAQLEKIYLTFVWPLDGSRCAPLPAIAPPAARSWPAAAVTATAREWRPAATSGVTGADWSGPSCSSSWAPSSSYSPRYGKRRLWVKGTVA